MRLVTAVLLLLWPAIGNADDWPQWMGPRRDNEWRESGVLTKFPEGGPRILWRVPVGGGYAGPAVADGRVYVTDYVTSRDVRVENFERQKFSGIERVLCLDEASGRQLWKHEYPVEYTISYPAGPRCTPNIHQGKVYTLGAEGHLLCLNAKTGEMLWSRHLPQDYDSKTPMWGYAAHPLIDGDRLICNPGGSGSHVVALDKDSGQEVWRALTTAEQGYSPPQIIKAAGARQLILFHPRGVESLDPETGDKFWTVPFEASNESTIMSPVRSGNLLYTAGFSNKNILIKLAADKPAAKMLWQDRRKKGVAPVVSQPYVEGETLFGFDQNGLLYGVDLPSGDRLWESGQPMEIRRLLNSGAAFMVRNGQNVWMLSERGELIIARLSRAGYQEIDRAKVIQPTGTAFGREVLWSPPAWANRRVYIRNDKECICVDLSQ